MLKYIIAFISVFIFINAVSIYIVGGFYKQTVESKLITEIIGIALGLFGVITQIDFKDGNKE